MRYFKYPRTSEVHKSALRAQYAALSKQEQRLARRAKAWSVLGTIVFFGVFLSGTVGGILAIQMIPEPPVLWEAVLYWIGTGILKFAALMISHGLGALAATPIWGRAHARRKSLSRQLLSDACAHLREYYGLREPYLVTKCYHADDKRFVNHDVCIFIVGDELRLTTNLLHGFFYGDKDLGCYAMTADEITLSMQQRETIQMLCLQINGATFWLGQRAKRFIERHFLMPNDRTTREEIP